jgi:hypothetical protein
VITENRNQFKTIAYKGFGHDTISNYRKETNDYLATHGGEGEVTGIEHHTTNTSTGDIEIYITTVSNPRDRDLILGLTSGTPRLTYTEETARGPSLRYGRKGMLHVGQLNKGGTRVSFRTNGKKYRLEHKPKLWLDRATIRFRFYQPAATCTGSFCVFGPVLSSPAHGLIYLPMG